MSTTTSATAHVHVGCSCIVLCDAHPGHVLVGRRLGSHGAGKLALPGGHLEFGESFAECLVREVKEETDLDIRIDASELAAFAINSPPSEEMGGKHYLTITLVGRVLPGSPELANMEPAKCEGWNWVPWEDLQFCTEASELFDPLRRLVTAEYNDIHRCIERALYLQKEAKKLWYEKGRSLRRDSNVPGLVRNNNNNNKKEKEEGKKEEALQCAAVSTTTICLVGAFAVVAAALVMTAVALAIVLHARAK